MAATRAGTLRKTPAAASDLRAKLINPAPSFGEVALLHRVERSANVTAMGVGSAHWVDSPAFVLAVAGHWPTDEAGRACHTSPSHGRSREAIAMTASRPADFGYTS